LLQTVDDILPAYLLSSTASCVDTVPQSLGAAGRNPGWRRDMNNREKLINFMFDNDLDRRGLGELVHVNRQTVESWLAPAESSRHVEVPEMAIELLTLKLPAAGEPVDLGADD
jgi:hypothetical protein